MNHHFLLTNGRSGSNYFVQLLNQHPNIVNYGEVLGKWTLGGKFIRPLFRAGSGDEGYLDWMYESEAAFFAGQICSFAARRRSGKPVHYRRRADIASIGVKEFTVNLSRFGLDAYLDERPGMRLVTLVRENALERLVSAKLLELTGAVARTKEARAAAPDWRIALDPETLVDDLKVIEAENAAVRAVAARHHGPVFRLTYESFFSAAPEEQGRLVDRLLAFLGVEPARLASEHRKLRRASLRRTVSNYNEIAERLVGSRFEAHLATAS